MPTTDWNAAFEASPVGSESLSNGDNRIRALKSTIREHYAKEHYLLLNQDGTARTLDIFGDAISDDDEGRHIPGQTAAVFIGTTSEITALANNNGSVAFDTDTGQLRVNNGTNWTTIIVSGILGGATVLKTGTFPGNVTDGSGAVTQTGFTVNPISNQSDWNEVIDGDDTELSTTGTIAANTTARIYVDLGSSFDGTIKTLMNITHAGAGDELTLNHVWAFDAESVITGTGGNRVTQGAGGIAAGQQYTTLSHFYGRFVGIELQNISGSLVASINLARFEIHGVAS